MQNEVKLSFLGDFCPINRVEKLILQNDYEPFNNIKNKLKEHDYVIANLECPLTYKSSKIKKIGPNLKGHPKSIDLLKYLNINMVALANNHILDYDQEGLLDTLSLLKDNTIEFVGADLNIDKANKPLLLDINGVKICFINICEREFNIADENYAGANPDDLINTLKIIELYKSKVDYIIIIFHGGSEYYNYPTPYMQKRLRFYAEKGADLIICHHSHIISGYEIYNGTPIFYGLGNFIFDWKNKPSFWYESIMVNVIIKKDAQINFDVIPLNQCKDRPGVDIPSDDEQKILIDNFYRISSEICNTEAIKKYWKNYAIEQYENIFANIFSLNRYHRIMLTKRILPNPFKSKKKKMLLFNQFYCESHRETAFEILNERRHESRDI